MRITYRSLSELETYKPGIEITIEEEDYAQLKSSIEKNGFVSPAIVQGNVLVDGINRIKIAKELNISPIPTVEMPDNANPEIMAILLNLARRHLTAQQKVAYIDKLLDVYEAANKKKRKNEDKLSSDDTGKDTDTDEDNLSSEDIENPIPDVNKYKSTSARGSVAKIASVAGVSPTTVKKVKAIKVSDPQKLKEVANGVKSLDEAYKEVKQSKEEKADVFRQQAAEDREQRQLLEPNANHDDVKKVKEIYQEIRKTLMTGQGVISDAHFTKLILLCVDAVISSFPVIYSLSWRDQEKINLSMEKLISAYHKQREDILMLEKAANELQKVDVGA
jgi:ParB-like chromosome segregation protein Spo0J